MSSLRSHFLRLRLPQRPRDSRPPQLHPAAQGGAGEVPPPVLVVAQRLAAPILLHC